MVHPRPSVLGVVIVLGLLAGCSKSEQQQTGDALRSDMPLHDAAYYLANDADRIEMQGVCNQWKASQRPPLSWPSIVAETCNNVATANEEIRSKKDRASFKSGMGI